MGFAPTWLRQVSPLHHKTTLTTGFTAHRSAPFRSCSDLRTMQLRIVLRASRRSHAKPLLHQLHWLPVQQRITYLLAVLTYKVRSTSTPVYLHRRFADSQNVYADELYIHHPAPLKLRPYRAIEIRLLHCALSLAAQCIVIGLVCVCVCVFVGLFVCGSVTTITRSCVHRSSPNWVCR